MTTEEYIADLEDSIMRARQQEIIFEIFVVNFRKVYDSYLSDADAVFLARYKDTEKQRIRFISIMRDVKTQLENSGD
jgi:hypothetical protein